MNRRLQLVPRLSRAGAVLSLCFCLLGCSSTQKDSCDVPFGIVIHGGAGVRDQRIFKENPELEKAYRDKLREALTGGYEKLKNGESSVDAVEAAIRVMEDSPLFNAGKGASFTSAGTNELDASIMNGKTLRAGGIGAVPYVKNPISLARLVMEKTPHVLLVGEGALAFAKEQGVAIMPADYFYTERKWRSLQHRLKENVPYGGELKNDPPPSQPEKESEEDKFGTVGAAALDKAGNLAAGTSTGGRVKKRPGRVGDSPIVGASTYANNETCAVSTTGLGEKHMVLLTSKEISALMAHKGMSLKDAANLVVKKQLVKIGGSGGAVAIDKDGSIAMPFTGDGMYRGYIGADGKMIVSPCSVANSLQSRRLCCPPCPAGCPARHRPGDVQPDRQPGGMTLEEVRNYFWADTDERQARILEATYQRLGLPLPQAGLLPPRVRIMTMHGVKGLSATVVFVPGLEESIFPGNFRRAFPGLILEAARQAELSTGSSRIKFLLGSFRIQVGHS